MDSMDELRSPSLPTSPAAPIIVFPSPSTLSSSSFSGQYGVQRNRRQLRAGSGRDSESHAMIKPDLASEEKGAEWPPLQISSEANFGQPDLGGFMMRQNQLTAGKSRPGRSS